MLRLSAAIILLCLPLLAGCAALPPVQEKAGTYNITDISKGLPTEGLWRENVALYDMNGDGMLDIVAPPPRKAPEGSRRPFVFLRDKNGGWREGSYVFPEGVQYGYGAVAVGDLNGDGYPDIVFAEHSRNIVLFLNDGKGRFIEAPLSEVESFQSRCVELSDINGDGWLDIVALSEAPFTGPARGILVGLNKGGKGWDIRIFDEPNPRSPTFGDSLSVGDIRGEGKKDIVIAQLSSEPDKRLIWFGDGKGDFKYYKSDIAAADKTVPFKVRLGDVDGDGKDEAVFELAQGGAQGGIAKLAAFKWTGDGFKEISAGLENEFPVAFDLVDLDGDGKKEMVLLSKEGIRIYKYMDSGWVRQGKYDLPSEETRGASFVRAGKNRDGSWLMVYNLGYQEPRELHHGIRAFLINKY